MHAHDIADILDNVVLEISKYFAISWLGEIRTYTGNFFSLMVG